VSDNAYYLFALQSTDWSVQSLDGALTQKANTNPITNPNPNPKTNPNTIF